MQIDRLHMQSRSGCLRAAADVPHLTAGDWKSPKDSSGPSGLKNE
jgi:hypothetical protein